MFSKPSPAHKPALNGIVDKQSPRLILFSHECDQKADAASLERNKARGVRCADTGFTRTDRLVCNRKFSQVVAHHLRFYFDVDELLSVVHAHHRPDHFWHDNEVAKVSVDRLRFLSVGALQLGDSQFLHKCRGLPFNASLKLASLASPEQGQQVIHVHIQQFIQIYTSIAERAERALLHLPSGSTLIGGSVRHGGNEKAKAAIRK